MDWKSHIEGLLGAGATVDQLASGMGVTPNAVREILAGRTRSPRAEAAFKLVAMKAEHFSQPAGQAVEQAPTLYAQIRQLVDSRMSKRALRQKFGFKTDAHLAKVLGLPLEQVEGWGETDIIPALPQVMRLLGHEEQPAQQRRPQDPDADRIVTLEVA